MRLRQYCFSLIVLLVLGFCSEVRAQGNFIHLTVADGLNDNRVTSITQLPDNRMLITTESGFSLYDGNRFRSIHLAQWPSIPLTKYSGAYHIYSDCNGYIWTKDYRTVRVGHIMKEGTLDHAQLWKRMGVDGSKVEDLFVDSQLRHLWLVMGNTLVDTETHRTYPIDANHGEIQDLETRGGYLYLFMRDGMLLCKPLDGKGKSFQVPSTSDYPLTSMVIYDESTQSFLQIRCAQNPERSILQQYDIKRRKWRTLMQQDYLLCTSLIKSPGIASVNSFKATWTVDLKTGECTMDSNFIVLGEEAMTAQVNTAYVDRQGGTWMGTSHQGIIYSHPFRDRFISVSNMYSYPQPVKGESSGDGKNSPYFKLTDSRGREWSGWNDGLELRHKGKDTIFYVEDGISGHAIYSLVEDHAGRLWAGTSHGITCVETSKQGDILFRAYDNDDGTLRDEYSEGGAEVLPDSTIFMAGLNGMTKFHPDKVELPTCMFKPALVAMTVTNKAMTEWNGKVILYIDSLILNHDYHNLSMTFSAFNYALPRHTRYRYRLIHDADTLWSYCNATMSENVDKKGMLRLNFNNLDPGEYQLEVQAYMGDASCAEETYALYIKILPPWWETTEAYIAYVLSFIIFGFTIGYLFMRHRMKQMEQQLREENLLARIRTLMESQISTLSDTEEQHEEENQPTQDTPLQKEEDREFLNKAMELVEQNLTTPGYSVERLAQDLCMERTGLYKRLTSLLDQSPSLFIRNIKLRHAARLLSTTDLTVGEVAEQTGFSNASHLTRLFHEEYGCTPSAYKASISKTNQG